MNTKIASVVSAFFIIAAANASHVTWTAGDAENPTDWFSPANWDSSAVPAEGDEVVIPANHNIVLTNATATLSSISVAGTITFENWMTRLNAANVTLAKGAVITCAGPFIPGEMSNRVWIACGNLEVSRGGRIHADAKGYKGGNKTHKDGYGPGAIPGSDYFAGGGHGGNGSFNGAPRRALATNEYGSASAPITPGSGGWGGNGSGGAGGGVVTIEASGCVTVFGSVTADGQESLTGSCSAGGSGGSVFISAKTFQGAYGKISAKGGTASSSYSQQYRSGGGGRVAILFDKEEQSKLPCPEGMYYGADSGGFLAPASTMYQQETLYYECMPGSLYFSSDTLIDRNGATLFGKLDFADIANKWTVDSVRLTNGWVMMARDEVEVDVTGDFEVTGDTLVTRRWVEKTKKSSDATRGTRWDVGGASFYYATNGISIYRTSSSAPRFTVRGDLKVNNYGLFYVFASEYPLDPAASEPATTNLGAKVIVKGATKLENIGKIYVKSNPCTGVSPVFDLASLLVDEKSWIDADNAGFFGSHVKGSNYEKTYTRSLAPTITTGKNGGGHGGAGGGGGTTPNKAGAGEYDSVDWPVLCGGSGCCDYQWNNPDLGGGVLRFFVDGEVKIDGVMRSNGNNLGAAFCGAPAGGTVLVVCDHIVGNGSIQAKGGNGYAYQGNLSPHNGGAGGGGRIAVHYNQQSQANVTCNVTFDTAGGAGVGNGVYTGSGKPGTVWFTDDKVVLAGKSHSGSIYAPELINYIRKESLVVENGVTSLGPGGYVVIEKDLTIRGASSATAGFEIPKGYFHVGGNLIVEKGHITVSGDAEKPRSDIFAVGGNAILNNAVIEIECSDEDRDQVVSFGGEVFMTNSTTIALKSPCDEVEGEPGLIFKAQKLQMHKGCWIYPWSHNTNGASVLMKINEIRCVPDSGINADAKGYGRTTARGSAYGPLTTEFNGAGYDGANAWGAAGPGHGGAGGSYQPATSTKPRGYGLAFDDYRMPVFAGPGGAGDYVNGATPSRGGGVIRIESTYFNLGGGTLTANGGGGTSFRTGGAGGSIYITADRFFGNNGFLYAKGGNGYKYGFTEKAPGHKNHTMQGGGGGRIAVHFKNSALKAMAVTASVAGGVCPLDVETCLNTYGEDVTALKAQRSGQEGTIYWGGAARGLSIIVR